MREHLALADAEGRPGAIRASATPGGVQELAEMRKQEVEHLPVSFREVGLAPVEIEPGVGDVRASGTAVSTLRAKLPRTMRLARVKVDASDAVGNASAAAKTVRLALRS